MQNLYIRMLFSLKFEYYARKDIFGILLILILSIAWIQPLEHDKSQLSIVMKEEGMTTISWKGIKNNMKSIIKVYMKIPSGTFYRIIPMKIIEVPNEIYSTEYKFEYQATYIIKLFTSNISLNRTFSNDEGIPLSINYTKQNCMNLLITWPALANVESYQLSILDSINQKNYIKPNLILPSNLNSYSHNFTVPNYYTIKVMYNFQNSSKTFVMERTLSIGRDICPATDEYSLEPYIKLYCSVFEEDKKCHRKLFLYVIYQGYDYNLAYDEEKKCFTAPKELDEKSTDEGSTDEESEKPKLIYDQNWCVDLEKSFSHDPTKIMNTIIKP